MKRLLSNLTFQVLVAIFLGVLVGRFFPGFAPAAKMISNGFIDMIKWLIAPIIFLTIVLGIASMGDMKKVGKVGGKALLYFEVVTTFALFIGLAVANLTRPGEGFIHPAVTDVSKIASYQKDAAEMNAGDFLSHIIPHNIFDAFSRGDILQILFIAIFMGYGISHMGEPGRSLISTFDKLSKVFFNIMKVVMKLEVVSKVIFGATSFLIIRFCFIG